MIAIRHALHNFIFVVATAFSLGALLSSPAHAATAEDLNKDAAQALQILNE